MFLVIISLSFMRRRPPRHPPFPYTTLFRSSSASARARRAGCADRRPWSRPRPAHRAAGRAACLVKAEREDRKSTRLNSSHLVISYAVFCLKKKISYESDITLLHEYVHESQR